MGGGGGGGYPTGGFSGISSDELKESISQKIQEQLDQVRTTRRESTLRNVVTNLGPDEIGIAFLDVGQGNCAVVKLPTGEVIVVDCNIKEANVNIVDFLRRCGIDRIDVLVITHPHADHMSGLEDISKNLSVGELWISPFERDVSSLPKESRQEYEKFISTVDTLARNGAPIRYPTASSTPFRKFGDTEIRMYSPSIGAPTEGEQNIHEASIVMDVKLGGFSALFGGDLNEKGWERVAQRYNIRSKILNASHHGSDVGCNEEAVKTVSPKYTVISVGENNFGHPNNDAVKTYEKYSEKGVLFTDEGTVGFRGKKDGSIRVIQHEG
jgi:beta-lactamase superfamily II metal-dependent hydrolase